MRERILFFVIFLLFSACSFQTPSNEWQYKSASAFHAYTEDFLSDDAYMANNDLKRAIAHAKKSANLETLARVYLGKCALNISVGIPDNCQEYQEIATVVEEVSLHHYYQLIEKKFSMDDAKKSLDMSRATSKLLVGAIYKEEIDDAKREELLEVASYHGYKKAVLFWLHQQLIHSSDAKEQIKLKKKINILK